MRRWHWHMGRRMHNQALIMFEDSTTQCPSMSSLRASHMRVLSQVATK